MIDTGVYTERIRALDDYEVIWIKSGTGVYEVDFQSYTFAQEQALFLGPGQYFRVLHGELDIYRIPLSSLFGTRNDFKMDHKTRVLFNHVIKVGSIKVTPHMSSLFSQWLSNTDQVCFKNSYAEQLLKSSVDVWLAQKPFNNISMDEVDVVFDLKGLIDEHFKEHPRAHFYIDSLQIQQHRLQNITRSRLERTLPQLQKHRILLEAERELFFTAKTSKEITYDLGFNDPAYFNRFFKAKSGFTTNEFRDHYLNYKAETFVNDLLDLIHSNFKDEKSVSFYASKLHMTPKSLSAKVRKAIGKNVSTLINSKVISEAHHMLAYSDMKVQEIAFSLGFNDSTQFSHFFNRNTGIYPAAYRIEHLSLT